MIARLWKGWIKPGDADEYAAYVWRTGIAEYRSTPGNQGAWVLLREDGDLTEIATLSFWDDRQAIEGFAGEEIEVAKFYPEDDRFLVKRNDTVDHYRVVPGPQVESPTARD